ERASARRVSATAPEAAPRIHHDEHEGLRPQAATCRAPLQLSSRALASATKVSDARRFSFRPARATGSCQPTVGARRIHPIRLAKTPSFVGSSTGYAACKSQSSCVRTIHQLARATRLASE